MKPVEIEFLMKDRLSGGLDNARTKAGLLDSALKRVALTVGAAFTAEKIIEFGKAIIDARGEIESFQISFDTLIGDKDKSASFFGELKDFAVNTPLLLNDLAKSGQLLLGFGVDLDKVMPIMKQIGDISMGNADRFNSLTLAFAQMSATGKLMGQDLLQMINAGFNPLTVISQKTGKSVAQLKDEMSKGAISADMVADAFEAATAKGGKFNGMLEKQSKGIKGNISNLQGAIQDVLNEIGENGQGVITESISLATTAVKNYDKLGTILAGMIATYGLYRTAVMFAIEAEKGYTIAQTLNIKVLTLAEKAQKLLNKTVLSNPYVLAAVALGVVVTALIAFRDTTTAAEKAQDNYNKKIKDASDKEQERKERLESLVAELQNECTAETRRMEVLAIIKAQYPAFFKLMIDEKGHIRDLTKAWKAYNEEVARNKANDNKQNVSETKKKLKEYREMVSLWERYGEDPNFHKNGLSDNEKVLAAKYSNETLGRLKKKIEVGERELNLYEKDVREDNFNQWKVDLTKKTDKQIEAMRAALVKRAKAANGNKTRLATIGKYLMAVDEEKNVRKANAVTYGSDFEAAKTEWETAKKELAAIEKDKDKYTRAQYDNAKKREETAEKAYKDLGGETGSKLTKKENAAKKTQEEANELKVEQAERQQKIDAYNKERANQEKQAEFDIRQSRIDGLKEGYEKEKEQINLTYDKLIEENRLRQEQWVKELQAKEREEWINRNPDYKKEGKVFTSVSTVADLSAGQKYQLEEYTNVANEYQKTANDKLLKDLFDKYKNFEQRRTDLNKKFDSERKAIENGKTADGKDVAQDVKDAAIVELEKKRKEAMKGVNDEEVASMQKSSDLLVKLFEDASNKSVSEINKIMSETGQLLSYLSQTKTEDITPKFGFTAEQLKTLKASPEQIKAIQKAVNELYSAGVKKNPFTALIKGLKDLFKSGNDDDGNKSTEARLAKIGESAAEAAGMVGNMAGNLSKMFEAAGNEGAAEAMDTVQNVMSAVSNIGEGFAKGGIVGGIAAAVGEAANFIGQAFAASARHKAALKEIMNETIAQQREYNLLLMQQNLEYEKGTTILGTDAYGKAANAVTVMKQAVESLNKELQGSGKYSGGYAFSFKKGIVDTFSQSKRTLMNAYAGLADIEIKTGHKKTGLFGWGKGKDIYSSILGVYPDLIKANGEFNASLAETIINTKTMSDEDKAALQNMINLSKQAEEAWQSVRDYFEGIFGELGTTLSNALVDAFRNGTDAAKAFTSAVTGMLEQLAEQMIYSVTIAPYIAKAQDDMLNIMKNDSLTDEQKFSNYVSILDGLTDGILSQQGNYNALLEKFKKNAAEKGINLWEKDAVTQSGKSGAYETTASQESVTRVEGLYSSMLEHEISIDGNVENISEGLSIAVGHLKKIEENTSKSEEHLGKIEKSIGEMKNDIATIKRDGLKSR